MDANWRKSYLSGVITQQLTTTVKSSVELFTGAGGLALATHMVGFRHAGLFEWNADACKTLRLNASLCTLKGLEPWHSRVHQGNIRDVSFHQYDGVDLVAGGPPCQPFSMGGKAMGMEDGRDMIPHFIRAIQEIRPKAFIMENVRGLTRHAFANYLNYTILQLKYPEITRQRGEGWTDHLHRLQRNDTRASHAGLRYKVNYEILNAADFGVPQCRERIFIVGFRSDVNADWSFPEATHCAERLLYDQWVSGDYWESLGVSAPTEIPTSALRRLASIKLKPKPSKRPWKTIREAIVDLPPPFTGKDSMDDVYNHRFQSGARPYPGHTGSPFDLPSKTLKAGDHGVPGGENMISFMDGTHRYLTVRESARIQTFPDSWRFQGPWSENMRQLGNAVPVDLAKVVAQSVVSRL